MLYKVLLTRRPEEFVVEADTRDDALNEARVEFNNSIYESEVEERVEEIDEPEI